MAIILDGLGLEGSVLDGLAEWPASTTRKEWFAITRQLIQQTIADMDLDPARPRVSSVLRRPIKRGGFFRPASSVFFFGCHASESAALRSESLVTTFLNGD